MKNNTIDVNAQALFACLMVFWLVGFSWSDVPANLKLPAIGLLLGAIGTIWLTVAHLLFRGNVPFSRFGTKAILAIGVLLGLSAAGFYILGIGQMGSSPVPDLAFGILGLVFAFRSLGRYRTMARGEA